MASIGFFVDGDPSQNIQNSGFDIKTSFSDATNTKAEFSDALGTDLSQFDVIVWESPDSATSASVIAAIAAWVANGGRLVLAQDPFAGTAGIAAVNAILDALGTGLVMDASNAPQTTNDTSHFLFDGVAALSTGSSDYQIVDNGVGQIIRGNAGLTAGQIAYARSGLGDVLVSGDIDVFLDNNAAFFENVANAQPINIINGDDDANILTGTVDRDEINGFGGDDTLDGGAGSDVLSGGEGNDTAILDMGLAGSDQIDLGAGDDRVEISSAAAQVRISFTSIDVGNGSALDGNNNTNEDGGLAVRIQAEDGSDGLTGAVHRADDEGITFTSVGNTKFDVRDLGGTQRGDQFDIVILGTSGSDALGGNVNTTEAYYINGGAGADTINGESGADTLVGGSGDDVIDGKLGNDTLLGGAGDDRLIGGAGDDRLDGGADTDTVDYSAMSAATSVQVNLISNTVNAGAEGGFDTLVSIENAILGQGEDQFQGSEGANIVEGGLGADFANGRGGNDTFVYRTLTAADGLATQQGSFLTIGAGTAEGGTAGDTITLFETIRFTNGTDDTADDVVIDVVDGNAVVLTVADAAGVAEDDGSDAAASVSGNVLTNDINLDQAAGDAKIVTNPGTYVGTYGTLVLNEDGSYTYTTDPAATNALSGGETVTDSFSYTADDGGAGTSRAGSLVVTVTGVNDAAVIGGVVAGEVTEDTNLTVLPPTIIASETFEGGASGWTVNATDGPTVGTEGSLSPFLGRFGGTGGAEAVSKTFALANSDAVAINVDFLKIDSWDTTSTNSGDPDETFTVYINGVAAFTFQPSENSIGGSVGGADASGSFTIGGITGLWSVTSNGVDAELDGFDGQGSGERAYAISILLTGASDTIQLGFGTNLNQDTGDESWGIDNLLIRQGPLGPQAFLETSGTLTVTDEDAGEALFVAQTTNNGIGTFTLATDGSWTYRADNSLIQVQSLGVGETLTETFTAVTADGTTQDVTITVNGTNDAPVLTAVDTAGQIVEGTPDAGTLTDSGTLTFTDIDANDEATTSFAFTGTTLDGGEGGGSALGSFAITTDANGTISWTYTADDAALQALAGNQIVTETYEISVDDGNGGIATETVTVNIFGTNDAPVIDTDASVLTAGLTEGNARLTATGSIFSSDVDAGNYTSAGRDSNFSYDLTDANGDPVALSADQIDDLDAAFSVQANGSWAFTLPSPDYLPAGSTLVVRYGVEVVDFNSDFNRAGGSDTAEVVITIAGTNDAPVIALPLVAPDGPAVAEKPQSLDISTFETALSLDGLFGFRSDPDVIDSETLAHVSVSAVTNGGQDVYSFTTYSEGRVVIDIDGAIRPDDTGFDSYVLIYDAEGNLVGSDDDASTSDGAGGSTNGLDSYFDSTLPAGTYFVVIRDFPGNPEDVLGIGDPYRVQISAEGAAEPISYGATLVEDDTVDGDLVATGTILFSDADIGDSPEASLTASTATSDSIDLSDDQVAALTAGFTIDPVTGEYSYTAPNPDYLGEEETITVTFTVTVTDDLGATATTDVVFTIIGTNDAPTITGGALGTIADDASPVSTPATLSGDFNAVSADIDSNDPAFFAVISDGSGINAEGSTFQDAVIDGDETVYGTLTVQQDGSYAFVPNQAAVNALQDGETLTFTFEIERSDGIVGATALFTLTITGANDAPVAGTLTFADVTDNSDGNANLAGQQPVVLDLLTNASDPDDADLDIANLTAVASSTALTPAELSAINAALASAATATSTESPQFALDTALFDSLEPGETATVTFSYDVVDPNGAVTARTATITVNGALEVVTGTDEDDTLTGGGFGDLVSGGDGDDTISGNGGADTLNGNDGDDDIFGGSGADTINGGAGDDEILGGSGNDVIDGGDGNDAIDGGGNDDILTGGEGSDTIDGGSGTDTAVFALNWVDYTITRVGPNSYQLVAPNGDVDLVTNVEQFVFNGSGPFAAATILNDAPVAIDPAAVTLNETGDDTQVLATVIASDVDAPLGDVLSYAITAGNDGRFEIDGLGQVTLVAGGELDYEAATGYTLTVTVTDAKGLSDTATVTIGITDINDELPVFTSGTTASIAENNAAPVLVYDANATDADSAATFGTISYALGGADAAAFTIDSVTGEVFFNRVADFETKASYAFTVIATQGITATEQAVTLAITNVNEALGPVIVTGNSVNENAANGTVVATATAIDLDGPQDVTYSLDDDAGGRFAINAATGVITVARSIGLDFEQSAAHSIVVRATDSGGLTNATTVVIAVNDVSPETVVGTAGNDVILGGAGNDTINGGAGADRMVGGAGNDSYRVDQLGDVIEEAAGGGTDTVFSTISWTLGANLENLALDGGAVIDGTGNALNNVITGNAANNRLEGGDGNDTLNGGLGSDTLVGGAGNDTMFSDPGSQAAGGSIDTLIGGTGNDSYFVNDSGDVVIELAGEGTDLVTSTASYTLSDNVENLTLTGTAAINGTGNGLANTLRGNEQANMLAGGAGNDILFGNGGNDTLDGGIGNDQMSGGLGDDIYVVDALGDTVSEAGGGGTDTIRTTLVSYTLLAGFENLEHVGATAFTGRGNGVANVITGGDGADNLQGLAGADTLNGGLGNDTLDGGTGIDTMAGGDGDDLYFVDNVGDVIVEAAGGGTNDRVSATVSYTLSAEVENLTLGGTTALDGTGNGSANTLTGNGAANTLNGLDGNDMLFGNGGNDVLAGGEGNDFLRGGDGDDQLTGGAGVDQLQGGAGADRFLFDDGDTGATFATGDTVQDFSRAQGDRIDLSAVDAITGGGDDGFTFIGGGAFTGVAGELRVVTSGTNQFVQGDLDGNGTADLFITVAGAAPLVAADFVL